EQLKNPSKIDQRADIWSLGVTMYNALSRRHPFEGGSLAELLVAVMSGVPTPLATRCSVSTAMLTVVQRCIERSLDRRFRDVGEAALALAPIASPRWAALAPSAASIARSGSSSSVSAATRDLGGERTLTFDEPVVPNLREQAQTLKLPDS